MWQKVRDSTMRELNKEGELEVDFESFMRLHVKTPAVLPTRSYFKDVKYLGFDVESDISLKATSVISFYLPGYGGFYMTTSMQAGQYCPPSDLASFARLLKEEGVTLVHCGGDDAKKIADIAGVTLPSIDVQTRRRGGSLIGLADALEMRRNILFHLVDARDNAKAFLEGRYPLQFSFFVGKDSFSPTQLYYLTRDAMGPLLLMRKH